MAKDTDTQRRWRILMFSGQSDGDPSARPTAQQLKTGNAKTAGNFTEISHNMALDVLWRQKLGQLYMENLAPQDFEKHQNWVLEALPANYQLYAQMKPNSEPVSASKLDGHFFGLRLGNSNVDFQSPEEFFPHLAWLGSDRSKACGCSHCNKPQKTRGASAKQAAAERQAVSKAPAPAPPAAPVPTSAPVPAPTGLIDSSRIPLAAYAPLMQADSLPSAGLYRPGEMVWANPNDTYPVISIIAQRRFLGQEIIYDLLPLKSPRIPTRESMSLPQGRLRPWLSYTPPNPLQPSISNRKYEVKWEDIQWQEWTHQDAELHDASIIASIRIACNIGVIYSAEGSIACLWMGAEKVWRNGEVRFLSQEIEGQKGMDVLVIKNITHDNDSIVLQGNAYCKVVQFPSKRTYPDPAPTPSMMADAAALQCSWHLKYANVVVNAMEIRGRWYPTSILGPIISPGDTNDHTFYDIGGLLNPSTDIPNQCGGWKLSSSRDEHILGIGSLPNQVPAGWINVNDWKRLYTSDIDQLKLSAQPSEPVVQEPLPKAPAKKPATRRVALKKTTNKKQAAMVPQAEEEPGPPDAQQAASTAVPPPAEGVQTSVQPALFDDDQADFLRQLEQDGADFEKAAQEGDLWDFFG